MEAVEDNIGIRQGIGHGMDECRPHVPGNGLNACGAFLGQGVEKPHQAVFGAPLGHPHQIAGLQVVDHSQVIVALGPGDLIDAEIAQARQRTGIQTRQLTGKRALIHGLDGTPGQARVPGYGINGHVPAQLRDKTAEAMGVGHAGIHERQVLHAPIPGADLDLAVLDGQRHRTTPQRQILDAPAQSPIDRAPPPVWLRHRGKTPVPVAVKDQCLFFIVPVHGLDALAPKAKNLCRDDCCHVQTPSVLV
ncbi:MAG: hypothetical protein L0H75_09710 [Nitrosospira sp.]|nr:hypothetical protein [Nitrosospira sp.]